MTKFHNADPSHRWELLASAEAKLTQLQSSNDGDGICALVRRVAGWLAPPRLSRTERTQEDKGTTQCEDLQPSLQPRIRQLLISALESLDLKDLVTFQAVEAAVNHIQALAKSLELESTTKRTKDWKRLRSLVHRELRRVAKGEDRATSVEGIYHPSKKVKGLLMVSAREQKVQLRCPQCPQTLSSNWFWTHPVTGEMKVIVPSWGHSACYRKVGKVCPWRSLDGTPTINDKFSHLHYCEHKRPWSKCKECGGSEICRHNRQGFRCRECKSAKKHCLDKTSPRERGG